MANTKVTGDVIANGTISTVHIADDAITAAKLDSTATGITFADLTVSATTATLNLSGSNTGASLINFGDSDDGNVGRIYYDHTSNFMQFKTNDSEKMRIDSSGNVEIGANYTNAKLSVGGNLAILNTKQLNLTGTLDSDLLWYGMRYDNNEVQIYTYYPSDRSITFNTVSGGTGITTQLMKIEAGGNVGINETSPASSRFTNSSSRILDISGNAVNRGGVITLRTSDNSKEAFLANDAGLLQIGTYTNNDVTLYTNNIERTRITSDGNVGIGTASPETNAKLDVRAGSGGKIVLGTYDANYKVVVEAGDQLNFYNGASATTAYMNYGFSGTPGNILLSRNLFVEANSSGGTSGTVRIKPDGNVGIKTTSPQAQLHINEDTSNSYATLRLEGANRGGIIDMYNAAYPVSRILTDQSGNIYISTSGAFASTSLSEKFTILTGGNVGIGTTSPAQKLHVVGKMQISDDIKLAQTNGRIDYDNGVSTGALRFWSTSGNSERMRITSAGNVGIGADSPATKLEVRQVDDTFDDLDLLTLKRVWSTASGSDRAHGIRFSDNNAILANIYADRTNSGSNYNSDLVFITNTGASGTDTSEKMRIDNGGSIHQNYISGLAGTSDYGFTIAKQTGYSQVYFRADTTSTRYIQRFYNDNSGTLQNVGNIIISGSTTSYATSSDYRLKENVVEMTGALDRISQLKPSRFNFIGDADKTVDGFLAHEVQDIVPEAITGEKDSMRTEEYEVTPVVLDEEGNITEEAVMGTREVPEYQGIDQSKLVPLLVGAIQELKADNDSLRARIEILENQ